MVSVNWLCWFYVFVLRLPEDGDLSPKHAGEEVICMNGYEFI